MLRQTKDRCIVDIVYWETAILGALYFPKKTNQVPIRERDHLPDQFGPSGPI